MEKNFIGMKRCWRNNHFQTMYAYQCPECGITTRYVDTASIVVDCANCTQEVSVRRICSYVYQYGHECQQHRVGDSMYCDRHNPLVEVESPEGTMRVRCQYVYWPHHGPNSLARCSADARPGVAFCQEHHVGQNEPTRALAQVLIEERRPILVTRTHRAVTLA